MGAKSGVALVSVVAYAGVMRTAKTVQETWEMPGLIDHEPHGKIQWKGTDVCMDVHCGCGHSWHVDGDFVYEVKCPECGADYAVSGQVELIKIESLSTETARCLTPPRLEWKHSRDLIDRRQ